MKILYAAPLHPGSSALTRKWALERLGHEIIPFDPEAYVHPNPIVQKLAFRLAAGPNIDRLNRDLLTLAETHKPDLLWADKLLWIKPATLNRLRQRNIATVSYMIDNAFGPRRDPGWRLYRTCIPHFDLHVTQRDSNLAEYQRAGARDVLKIQTAYEPTQHYPPPPTWSDANRTTEVSFIGTPYDDRAQFLTQLAEAGLSISIRGDRPLWSRALSPEAFAKIYRGEPVYDDAYREAIWRAKINLSFITHSNQDEFAHKSFEIAGCGGLLLAERSQGHTARFVEGEEAVFFNGIEECIAQIRRYLQDEPARARIAAAGHARAQRDGYHNDRQVALILERLATLTP